MIKIYVNPYSSKPLYRQIVEGIAEIIQNGELARGEKLPTVRELAVSLGVNPNTVARAYRELERSGLIETFTGRGTFVSKEATKKSKKLEELICDVVNEAKKNNISIDKLCEKIKERSGDL